MKEVRDAPVDDLTKDRDDWKRLHDAAQRVISDRNQALNSVSAERDALLSRVESVRAQTFAKCASIASSHPGVNFENARGQIDWRVPSGHDIADAIRAAALQENTDGN